MKLEIKPTERGFLRADFKDRYGLNCSIQESSIATEACLWLGANQGKHLVGDSSKEWTDETLEQMGVNCMSRMHLTQEIAGELAKQLAYFARNGKLKLTEKTRTIILRDHLVHCWYKQEVGKYNYKKHRYNRKPITRPYYLGIIPRLDTKHFHCTIEEFGKICLANNNIQSAPESFYAESLTPGLLRQKRIINIIKWLSEGQQGFYTPQGLVKEL